MTSVFEVLSNKETQAENDFVKATVQKHQSTIQTNKENEPSRKYFWCASYIDMMSDIDALPYKFPACNHTAIDLLPLSNGEHYRFEYTATEGRGQASASQLTEMVINKPLISVMNLSETWLRQGSNVRYYHLKY